MPRPLTALALLCLLVGCSAEQAPSAPDPEPAIAASLAPVPTPGPTVAEPEEAPTEAPPPAFAVEPVTSLLPELRIDADAPLAADVLGRALAVPGVTFATAAAVGATSVTAGDGEALTLTVAAVDPAGFRVLSPQISADAPELWQRLVEGYLVITHELAEAELPVGSIVETDAGPLGVGAAAAIGHPPVADAIITPALGEQLGLPAPSTLLIAVEPEAWPDEVADALEDALDLPVTLIYGKPQRTMDGLPPDGTVWDELALCESSGRWDLDSGNGYYGGLQFLPSSWHLVGGTGMPHEASRDEQVYRAQLLLERQGWRAWPVCTVRLGLREPEPDEHPDGRPRVPPPDPAPTPHEERTPQS